MLSIITNYWLEWLLGLIATGLGFTAKKFYSLYQKEKQYQRTKEQKKLYDDITKVVQEASNQSRQKESELQQQIDIIKEGILSLQGRLFKQECRRLLEPNKDFTVAEFEELQNEHEVYNRLGGNSTGDKLFRLVEAKADKVLTDDK